MRSPIAWLALALIPACAFAFTFIFTFVFTFTFTATSEMDIDYSHSVVGTGTLITDYHMGGAEENSEASGKVRGTGNVMNKYLFLSGNDSQNVTIEDEFVFSDKGNASLPTMDGLPARSPEADKFRLTGAAWAEKLEVMSVVNSSANASNSSSIDSGLINSSPTNSSPTNSSLLNNSQLSLGQLQGASFPIAGKGRFNLTENSK